ncbi:MAG: DUF2088 domain-containing protein [Pedosphaera sp.]|nr:DUF2088 domain-containing protein [Pedosphaera sp.]
MACALLRRISSVTCLIMWPRRCTVPLASPTRLLAGENQKLCFDTAGPTGGTHHDPRDLHDENRLAAAAILHGHCGTVGSFAVRQSLGRGLDDFNMIKLFPQILAVRQTFPQAPPVDIRATLQDEFAKILPKLKPGARVAVAVGSRGITNLQRIVATVLDLLKAAGARPFIVPAMGSHGGATSEGQKELLAEYGIREDLLQVPICAAMDVERLGVTEEGLEVVWSGEALRADGVVIVNRVKPHTDFSGALGSGILKMMVVGLGKHSGAAKYHTAAVHLGYEHVLRTSARLILRSAPILCGVAIVENQLHETAKMAVLLPEEMERREEELFQEAKRLMPSLPFDDIDLLIVDRLGKNISGSGMDPNIIGRGVHGYESFLGKVNERTPLIRRVFVRDLTPQTHGNAIGVGLADVTTTRLVRAMNPQVTFINALTSLALQCAKIPMHFDTDREAIGHALNSLALPELRHAKVVRIADTLSLEWLEISEACAEGNQPKARLEPCGTLHEMSFDADGNLLPLTAGKGSDL